LLCNEPCGNRVLSIVGFKKKASNTKKSAKNNHFYKEDTVPEFKFVQNLKDTKEKKNL